MYLKSLVYSVASAMALTFGTVTLAVAMQNGGPPVPLGPEGPSPAPAISGGIFASPYAQAIGQFGQSGVPVRTKNITAITHPTTGVYCITVGAVATFNSAPIVTVEWGGSLGVALFAQWDASKITCSGTPVNVYEVRTYKADTGGVGSSLQTPALSNSVAFVFELP
jgi:hypothetical protein